MPSSKIVHSLQLPYLTPQWPSVSRDNETIIVRNLVDLIRPIGEHRRFNVIPSKGRRRKKRKLGEQNDSVLEKAKEATCRDSRMPSIFDSITIGFNSTIRLLEAISQHSKPKSLKVDEEKEQESQTRSPKLGAVFVCRSALPDLLTVSAPLLIATASQAQLETSPIRLVQLSAGAETQLAEALNQPRVGFLGVHVNGDTDGLLALVQAAVAPMEVPWLNQTKNPRYMPIKIESTDVMVGFNKRQKQTLTKTTLSQAEVKLRKSNQS